MDNISEIANEYSRLWDEAKAAEAARYKDDCYGDLPKDRGPHVLGRSEKGLEADRLEKKAHQELLISSRSLRALIEKQIGIDPWKIRCLFV